MSHVHAGPLASYNSLLDPSLQTYFGNSRMRKHLRKAGLVKKSGQIIPEETIRANFAKKVHKDQVKDLLAREIIYKTLDIERTRQVAIKNELERTAKKELVQRVRRMTRRRGDEEILPFMVPRPSTAPVRRTGRSSPVRPMRPESGQPYTQSLSRSSSSPVSTVDSCRKSLSKGSRSSHSRGRKKKSISVDDFRHSGLDDKHLYALDQTALWKITMGELVAGLTSTSPYLLPQPFPFPLEPPSGRTSPSRGRRSRGVVHPTDSQGKSTKRQNTKIPRPPSSGQPNYVVSRRGRQPRIWRKKPENTSHADA